MLDGSELRGNHHESRMFCCRRLPMAEGREDLRGHGTPGRSSSCCFWRRAPESSRACRGRQVNCRRDPGPGRLKLMGGQLAAMMLGRCSQALELHLLEHGGRARARCVTQCAPCDRLGPSHERDTLSKVGPASFLSATSPSQSRPTQEGRAPE